MAATVPPPPASSPTPSVGAVGCTTASLSWSAIPTATSYDLSRAANGTCAGATFLANTTSTTRNETSLTANTTYSYLVTAKNACGAAPSPGSCVSLTTTAATPVGNSVTTFVSGSNLVIRWSDVAGATSYRVLVDSAPNGTFATQLGTASSGATGLTVPIPADGHFRVAALTSCGWSAP